MTHVCVGEVTISSDNGLLPVRHQAIIYTNAGILLIGPLGINCCEICIEINISSFKKMHLKMSSAKWWPSWPQCVRFSIHWPPLWLPQPPPICAHLGCYTAKPVYNDHLMGYFSAFWSSSRWPRATSLSSRRQKLLTRVNWYLKSSLKHATE